MAAGEAAVQAWPVQRSSHFRDIGRGWRGEKEGTQLVLPDISDYTCSYKWQNSQQASH